MINNLSIKHKKYIPRRKRKLSRRERTREKRKSLICLSICLITIVFASFFLAYRFYVSSKSTDLSYAVDYTFTHGFFSKDKLLRVQKMSLIYSDGETAIVEASGLSKESPHKEVSITGSFKKDSHKSWHLDTIQSST